MLRTPPRFTRTDTLCPYTTRLRSPRPGLSFLRFPLSRQCSSGRAARSIRTALPEEATASSSPGPSLARLGAANVVSASGRATSLIDNNLALVRKAKESIVGDDSRAASKAGVRLRQPAGRADLRNRLPAQGRSYAVTVHGAHSGNRIKAASPAGATAHGS